MISLICHLIFVALFSYSNLCVWDLRKVKVKKSSSICSLPHGRSISSAYFSPVSGKYILSTSMDDKLTYVIVLSRACLTPKAFSLIHMHPAALLRPI